MSICNLHDISGMTVSTCFELFFTQGLPGADGPAGEKGETVCVKWQFSLVSNQQIVMLSSMAFTVPLYSKSGFLKGPFHALSIFRIF